jgi:hypothetical protein
MVGGEKAKGKIFHDTWKWYKIQFPLSVIKVSWKAAMLTCFLLSVAAFVLQQ